MPKNPLKTSKNSSKSKGHSEVNSSEYERFGRYMADVYETGYINKKRMYKATFIKGVLSGFGGVIGATIVVGLALWLLSFFDSIPLIDTFVNKVENTVEPSR